MKRFVTILMIIFYFIFAPPCAWSMNPYLKAEPPLWTRVNWDVAANGMVYVSYDRDGNGRADFHTLRLVVKAFLSTETTEEVAAAFPGRVIFSVNYGSARFFYVTEQNPLFYAVDVNEDGHWDLVYNDPYRDGVNGNEAFYDSPSGMFTPNIVKF